MIWAVLYFGTEIVAAIGPLDMTMRECAERSFYMPAASQAIQVAPGMTLVRRGEMRCVFSQFRPGPSKGA